MTRRKRTALAALWLPFAYLATLLNAWSAFEEEGVFNADTGKRYLKNILEVGGSRDAIDNFKAFRGREPNIDALLRHNGMTPGAVH